MDGGGTRLHVVLIAIDAVIHSFNQSAEVDLGLVRAAIVRLVGNGQCRGKPGDMAHAEGEERVLGQRVVGVIEAQAVELNGGGHILTQIVVEQVGKVAAV